MFGDKFPSTEGFIVDQSGKGKLFLGAIKEEGGIGNLFGDNKEDLFDINMTILFDKKGNFIGVKQGDILWKNGINKYQIIGIKRRISRI